MSQIQQVKESSDIIEEIGARIDLKRAGANYKAPCPFHSEKTPSFFVNEVMQRYRCFGCGETGDVFTFLEKYEGMSFYEALRYLAEKAGVKLTTYKRSKDDELRDELSEVLNLAKEYYHFLLTQHKVGKPALKYLSERGTTKDSIKQFQLGFAPSSWDSLIKYLHGKKKYSLATLVQAGLIIRGKGGRHYDRFRGRVIFPLKNHRGQVVGFSGRLLDSEAKEAKYINTPETQLYHKSQLLYGLSEQYSSIRKRKKVVIVEGEFDVISSAQAHVPVAVAIKGSALTADHVRLLARTVEVVLLALDTDEAGQEATRRAIDLLRETELELKVVIVPEGKDPDDLIRSNDQGPGAWREALKRATSAYDFLIESAAKKHGVESAAQKRKVLREIGPVLAGVEHAVEREHYVRRLVELLETTKEAIEADIKRNSAKKKLKRSKSKKPADDQEVAQTPERTELYALFLLSQLKPTERKTILPSFEKISATTPGFSQLIAEFSKKLGEDLRELTHHLPDDLQELLFMAATDRKFLATLPQIEVDKELKNVLSRLLKRSVRTSITQIKKELKQLDQKSELTPQEQTRQRELLTQLAKIRS